MPDFVAIFCCVIRCSFAIVVKFDSLCLNHKTEDRHSLCGVYFLIDKGFAMIRCLM